MKMYKKYKRQNIELHRNLRIKTNTTKLEERMFLINDYTLVIIYVG